MKRHDVSPFVKRFEDEPLNLRGLQRTFSRSLTAGDLDAPAVRFSFRPNSMGDIMKLWKFGLISLFLASSSALAKQPDCYGPERWAASMAFATLKNQGITDNDKVDFSKTQAVKLASEKIGKDKDYHEDLYRQVQNVKFTEKSGNVIEVITINDATKSECSMGSVEVYVVSKHINSDHSTETSTSK